MLCVTLIKKFQKYSPNHLYPVTATKESKQDINYLLVEMAFLPGAPPLASSEVEGGGETRGA